MTAKKRFKRHVRDRARKTGESYTAALAHARRRPEQERPMSEPAPGPTGAVVSGQPGEPGPIIVVSGPSGVGKSTVSPQLAAAFEPSVLLKTDALMEFVVNGLVQPGLPAAARQNETVGAALAATAMRFAADGYTTVVDGHIFPDGVEGLAAACRPRGLPLHYLVLHADLDTCWSRASGREAGRWPLERGPVTELHTKYAELDVHESHVVEAAGTVDAVVAAVLEAFRSGRLAVTATQET